MDKEKKFSLNQLDLLKEIGTIGSANAATALAELIGKKIDIAVPDVNLVPLEKISGLLGSFDELYSVLDLEIRGDISGRIFLLFKVGNAKNLAGILLNKPSEETDFNNAMVQSALKEAGNILCGAYVSALAEMSRLIILTSIPSLAIDMVGAILDFIFIQIAQTTNEALVIRTKLNVSGFDFDGLFLLFPTTESLEKIFEIFGLKE